jgi:hypothetical protein
MHRRLQSLDRHPKTGRFLQIAIATIAALLTFNALGSLIYGVLGQSLGSTAGTYGVVLYSVMLLATVTFSLGQLWPKHRWLMLCTHMATGIVVGFYYGGVAIDVPTAQKAPWAIAGAILGGCGCGLLTWRQILPMVTGSMRTIVLYGAAFLNGVLGLMLTSTGIVWGWGFLGLTIFCLWGTGRSAGALAK